MAVKVILKQDVPNVGSAGDIKQVASGYFRNFLSPRGLAVEATKGQLRALEASSHAREGQVNKAREQTGLLAERIGSTPITLTVRVGEQGRTYGSVTNKDLAEALLHQTGVTVDRHKIELREPLKTVGTHSVPVKLEHGVDATLQVELVPEEGIAES